eukprot:scaffold122670_cov21-Tisochrysis_lutea.AAC.2
MVVRDIERDDIEFISKVCGPRPVIVWTCGGCRRQKQENTLSERLADADGGCRRQKQESMLMVA